MGISPHTVLGGICDAWIALFSYEEPFHVQNVHADCRLAESRLPVPRSILDWQLNGISRVRWQR